MPNDNVFLFYMLCQSITLSKDAAQALVTATLQLTTVWEKKVMVSTTYTNSRWTTIWYATALVMPCCY